VQFTDYTSNKRFDLSTPGLKSSGHNHKSVTFTKHADSIQAQLRAI
jgi:hypothetical protein